MFQSRLALILGAVFGVTLFSAQDLRAEISAYVVDIQQVSSRRVTRDLTDFTYTIRVVNQGGAILNANAFVRSLSANTVIQDNDVILGTVPTGSTITSTDTFTLRQNRLVPFRQQDLVWTILGQEANTRPLANAGPDQTVPSGTTVTLDGSASTDADGHPLIYRWTLASKPAGSSATLSNSSHPMPTVVIDRGGDYLFDLIVNDGRVDSLADRVRVSTLNSAPLANAGPDRTVPRNSNVQLDGSASSDPDFDALSYEWVLVLRPTGSNAALVNPTTVMPSLQLDRPGDYRVRLIVSDAQYASSPDFINISTENSIPVANPGPDVEGSRGNLSVLDGSASSDADNDPISYSWTLVSRPANSSSSIAQPGLPQTTITPDQVGTYVVQLIVNDGWANSAPVTKTITVPQPVNGPPNAVADSATTEQNTAVTINVLANDSDPDNDALSIIAFSQPSSGGSVTQVAGGLRFTPSNGFTGTAFFGYTISDGQENASAAVQVTVTGGANLAPVVNAGVDQTLTPPTPNATLTVTLNGQVSDDGLPQPATLGVSWSTVSGPGPVAFQAINSATTQIQLGTPGVYILRLTGSDGALSSSDELQITVNALTNRAPVMAAIGNRTLKVGESIELQVTANDPDPQDTLTFSLANAPAGATLSATHQLRWTAAAVGNFPFTVSVRDQGNLTDSTAFTVTVTAANRAPSLGALTDDLSAPGANYVKSLVAVDPDSDSPLTFQLLGGPAGLALTGNQLRWTPNTAQVGTHLVQLAVRDPGGAMGVGAYRIEVESNTAPLAADDSFEVKVGETLTVNAPGVLANDQDAEGSPLTARKLTDPTLGTLNAFNADGSFSYTAPAVAPMADFSLVGQRLTPDQLVGIDLRDWPALGDLNRDGKPDLITLRYNDAVIIATSGGDGARLWGVSPRCTLFDAIGPAELLADIDDDGRLEYVFASTCPEDNALAVPGGNGRALYSARLQALSDDGETKWISPILSAPVFDIPCTRFTPDTCSPTPVRITTGLADSSVLSVARLTESGPPTILLRQWIGSNMGSINTLLANGSVGTRNYGCQLLTGLESDFGQECTVTVLISATDGSVQQVLRAPQRNYFNANSILRPYSRNPPIVVDLDGDGTVEIVSGSDVWRRVNGQWTLAWQSLVEPQQVAVVDIDGDGKTEIIQQVDHATYGQATGDPIFGFSGYFIYDRNGVEIRRFPSPMVWPGVLTAADVDGDGLPELLSAQEGFVHAIKTDGSILWTYTVPDNPADPLPQGFRTGRHTNVLAYDLDGNGVREIVFSSAGWVHILDGPSGAEKTRFDAGRRSSAPNSVTTFTHIADWDGDGHADILSIGSGGISNPQSQVVWVIKSANNDWQPAGKYHGAIDYRPSMLDEAGRVLFDTSTPREFRQPKRLGVARDPREALGTSFEYAANDGVIDSNNANVFIRIRPANSPPVITSRPPTAVQGAGFDNYIYQVTATDPDPADTISYSVQSYASNLGLNNTSFVSINAATGAVSIATGLPYGRFVVSIVVTATDSQGASTSQSFVVTHSTSALIGVPNVVGSLQQAAGQALNAVQLQAAVLQEQFSAEPIGTVIAQNPVGGSNQPRNSTVLLTVSKGLQPAAVPMVVGLVEGQANTRLTAAGFSVGGVTREFSATLPRGTVIAQSPDAGGPQVPGAVALTVSAGNGFAMRLNSAVTPANEPIAFSALSVDLNGNESSTTNYSATVVRVGSGAGSLPVVAGSNVVPDPTTRGLYRLTLTDTNGRSASAEFVVAGPAVVGEAEPMSAAFKRLAAALADIDALAAQARGALAANDVALQRELLRQMVLRWRLVDLHDLSASIPFAPDQGFAPKLSQMAGFGVDATPEDLLIKQILVDANADLKAWIDGLKANSTTMTELNRLADNFGTRAARLDGLTVSEWGVVNASGEYTVLLGHRIPQLYEAIMNELAVVAGLPANRTAAVLPDATGIFMRELHAANSTAQGDRAVQIGSTLSELLVTQAVQWVVDKVVEDAEKKYKAAKKFGTDIMAQAFYGAFVVASVSHIRQFVQGDDIGEVVSGASLSFRVFNSPYSFVEGPFDIDNPELSKVFVIGPTLFEAAIDLIKKMQEGMKYRKTLNPNADDGKYKNASEIKKDLEDFRKYLNGLKESAEHLRDEIEQIEQIPTDVDFPCVFSISPDCGQLIYENGFRSVYQYTPPPGFEGFTGLPLPITFVVYNYSDNTMYFATPPFFPTPRPEASQ